MDFRGKDVDFENGRLVLKNAALARELLGQLESEGGVVLHVKTDVWQAVNQGATVEVEPLRFCPPPVPLPQPAPNGVCDCDIGTRISTVVLRQT